jgi:hypothetical protein
VGEGEKNSYNNFLAKRAKKRKKIQHVLTKLVSIERRIRGDYKRKPFNSPSIQNGALVGVGSLWPYFVFIFMSYLTRKSLVCT